jgi:hypothetical protein
VNPMYTFTPKFVLLWLQMLPPWDLPLEFWTFWQLLSPGILESLLVLLLDLVPFAILCIVCLTGLHWVSPLWCTRNQWLITLYYMVHFNLPSLENIVVSVESKTNNIKSRVRVMVHVKVRKLSAILQNDDPCNLERYDREMGIKTMSP